MTPPRVLLVLTGVVFLLLGSVFLIDPEYLARTVDLTLDSGRAHTEIRAMYGGLELGLGAFFLVAATRPRWIRAGLGAMILGLGGLAAGRAVGILLTPGRADRLMMGFLAAELIGTALALAAFRRARQVLVENQFERRRLD